MSNKRLFDLFPNWIEGKGIFSKIAEFTDLPFENDIDISLLDIDFLGKYGSRLISPMAYHLLAQYKVFDKYGNAMVDDNGDFAVTDDNILKLAKIIWQRFGKNWSELYKTLSYDYDPIENYSMVEEESGQGESDMTRTSRQTGDTATQSANHNNIVKDNNTQKTATDNTIVADNQVYGFNSSSAVDSGKTTTHTTGDANSNVVTNNHELESHQNGTISGTTHNQQSDNESGSSSTKRKLTRKGNIGVTTSQQMIQSQRDLWMWDYFEAIFKEILTILTIPYYA